MIARLIKTIRYGRCTGGYWGCHGAADYRRDDRRHHHCHWCWECYREGYGN